ncbi:hypothetical protein YC2023_043791 [Brassica napus]
MALVCWIRIIPIHGLYIIAVTRVNVDSSRTSGVKVTYVVSFMKKKSANPPTLWLTATRSNQLSY